MKHDFSFYLYLQKRLLEHCDEEHNLEIRDFNFRVGKMRIPHKLHPMLLKELENLGLIERIDRYKIRIVNSQKCKKLEKLNKFYREIGIW